MTSWECYENKWFYMKYIGKMTETESLLSTCCTLFFPSLLLVISWNKVYIQQNLKCQLNIKLQLAGQQTLPFMRKTTKDVDNENLGNTNSGSDMQELQSSESTGTDTPTSEKQSDTSLIIFINA